MFRHLSTRRSGQSSSKPKFSFGKQLEPLSPLREEPATAVQQQDKGKTKQQVNNHNWLAEAEVHLKEDHEASKKELELIRNVIEDLAQRLASLPPDPPLHQHQLLHHKYQRPLRENSNSNERKKIRDQKVLMTACQEYARSRVHLLRQRMRQVAFWTNNRRLGQGVPEQAPDEWATADREWAQWLAEQAAARVVTATAGAGTGGKSGGDRAHQKQQQQKQQEQEERDFAMEHTAFWGPLAHVLDVYTWDHDYSGDEERYAEILGNNNRRT